MKHDNVAAAIKHIYAEYSPSVIEAIPTSVMGHFNPDSTGHQGVVVIGADESSRYNLDILHENGLFTEGPTIASAKIENFYGVRTHISIGSVLMEHDDGCRAVSVLVLFGHNVFIIMSSGDYEELLETKAFTH